MTLVPFLLALAVRSQGAQRLMMPLDLATSLTEQLMLAFTNGFSLDSTSKRKAPDAVTTELDTDNKASGLLRSFREHHCWP